MAPSLVATFHEYVDIYDAAKLSRYDRSYLLIVFITCLLTWK